MKGECITRGVRHDKARLALARVRGEESELKELWHEGDAAEWEASLDSLQAAVSA